MALTKIPASFIDTSSGITGDTTLTGNLTLTGYLAGPSTLTIDPAGVGDNTGTVVIAGNLQVDGTTTTINSTTLTVDDLNIVLASGAANAAAANGAGITINGASASLTYSSSLDAFVFNKDVDIDGGTIDGADITVGAGKTLDVSSGTLTLANDQISGDKIEGGTIGSVSITAADINGGTIDGVTIGGSSAGAITGTTITGTSFVSSGDMTFGDNDKAVFGAGSDLQIYHDGFNSYIVDAGTGDLYFRSASNLYIGNAAGTQSYITAADGGAVDLRYNGSAKLATTSTGINVTGTVTADGLTVSGSGTSAFVNFNNGVDSAPNRQLAFSETGGSGLVYKIDSTGASGSFGQLVLATNGTDRINLAANGDISFYDSAGTTAKFFWDASAEALGIGTSSPAAPLHVKTDGTGYALTLEENSGGEAYQLGVNSFGGLTIHNSGTKIAEFADSSEFQLYDGVAVKAKISPINDSYFTGGNVGIGTSSPSSNLHVFKGESGGAAPNSQSSLVLENNSNTYIQFLTPASNESGLLFGDADNDRAALTYNHASDFMAFRVAAAEAMRINSSGNVGIGTSLAGTPLTVSGDSGSTHALVGYFRRELSNVAVDILSVTNQTSNSGTAIYGRLVATAATSNNSAVIEFWASLFRAGGGANTATAVTPVVSKAIAGSLIGAGSLAWSGTTLQYTPGSNANYTAYSMELQITNRDGATITILP